MAEVEAECGDGAGDAERAPARVAVLLRGAAEQLGDGRAAQQLGGDDEPLRLLPLRADLHGYVPRGDLPAGRTRRSRDRLRHGARRHPARPRGHAPEEPPHRHGPAGRRSPLVLGSARWWRRWWEIQAGATSRGGCTEGDGGKAGPRGRVLCRRCYIDAGFSPLRPTGGTSVPVAPRGGGGVRIGPRRVPEARVGSAREWDGQMGWGY